MIISEHWLREWVTTELSTQEIADRLTLAGLEVDGVSPLAGEIEHLLVGHVLEVSKHPDADRLNLTKVDIGSEQLDIVCGASNVAEGLKVAVATVGAELPNGMQIKRAKVRGIESNGMLCSAAELGLEDHSDGILELGGEAEIGQRVDQLLALDDNLIDIDLTPNRGDCLSVQGVARELKILADAELHPVATSPVPASNQEQIDIELQDSSACPRYIGRIIKGIDSNAATPIWLAERLRRCGVRPISPVVDITNYVMLELGQPMHAFDYRKLDSKIVVRPAKAGEKIKLLDESTATLDEQTLVIADASSPIAIAGVMGGLDSAIGDSTHDIVLEAAHFTRKSAAGCARRYGLHTESSHRFERGVDPELPSIAMERATQLVLQICGGDAGPNCEQVNDSALVDRADVEIRLARLEQLLGMPLRRSEVSHILQRIVDQVQDTTTGWRVTPPSYRFDIEYEADLVEEVARVKGYDAIPTAIPRLAPRSITGSEATVSQRSVRQALVARDFREVITYSFIDPANQADMSDEKPVILENPLAENMSVMRTSLLPGVLQAAQFNHNRQQGRLRLFELGASYHRAKKDQISDNPGFVEKQRLAVLVTGSRHQGQWGVDGARAADFYDLKADLEAVLSLTGIKEPFIFNEFEHISMHPGQLSSVTKNGDEIGFIGRLHPRLEQQYGFSSEVFVFELDLSKALAAQLPAFQGVPKFPSIRRDLSVVVSAELAAAELLSTVRDGLGEKLKDVAIFDVYQGKGVEQGHKSVSLSLTLQDKERTLTDEYAEALLASLLNAMHNNHGARLRT